MKTLYEKEKKLKESIEKLNLIKTEDPNLQNSILTLDKQKNQVEIEDSQLLRRLIARRCIYGVDINETAVQLTRVGIWIHTFVPGLALSFLDHNFIQGNSLVGVGQIEEVKEISEIRNEKGIYNLQLLFYMVGIYKEIKAKFIKSGIISLKNTNDGVLEGIYEGKNILSVENIMSFEKELITMINEILDKNIMFEK